MKKITYLFYGFGSEYVLHPLYEEMKKRGYECVEIDALQKKNSIDLMNQFIDTPVCFITSAHLLLDKKTFTDLYPNTNLFYGVLEIISLLKPVRSVYIPHDLTQPLIRNEKDFLNQFNIFLSPCEPFTSAYSHYCKTIEVGWIKYRQSDTKIKRHKAVWFLSDFVLHQKMGKEQSFEKISPVLKQGIAIKFPQWMNYKEFEDYFSDQGIRVYPTSLNTIDLIKNHEIIITNGLSSIIAESYFLGKTTVNIMEGSHYGNNTKYLVELFPELCFVEKISDFHLQFIPKTKRTSVLKPFDMEKALRKIII